MAANLIEVVCWNGAQTILGYPILVGYLKKGVRNIVPSHEQEAEGARTAVAGNGRRGFLQVDPFKCTILLH